MQGVSGCGKSTLGQALGDSLSIPFVDGDDLHPRSNVEKMSANIPLTDADRDPWLHLIRTTAEHRAVEQKVDRDDTARAGLIVACSSLKKRYRDVLRGKHDSQEIQGAQVAPVHPDVLPTVFVYVKGEKPVLMERMHARKGHFMKETMLDSQLETLESPEGEEGVVVVPLEASTEEQVKIVREELSNLHGHI
jgi:gluconokinase